VRTTDRIRAAATLVWLGLALANHARAVDLRDRGRKYDSVANVRIEDARLSLHTERLPLDELLARVERSGLARIEVHGDVSGITVSDSFGYMDIAQALRRVLSAHSNVLIDRAPQDHDPRAIVLILLASPAGERTGPGFESDWLASGSAAIGLGSPADVVANAGLSSASLVEREGRKSRAPLRRALADVSPEVRAHARELIEDSAADSR
jgi:hypothetical protein